MEKTDLVLITLNRIELTKLVLKCIFTKNPVGSFNLIICDGGSTDGTREYLEKYYSKCTLLFAPVFAPEKQLLSDNLTMAVPYITSDPFITTCNDILVAEDNFIPKLREKILSSGYDVIKPRNWVNNYRTIKRPLIDGIYMTGYSILCDFRTCRKKILDVLGHKFLGGHKESRSFMGRLGRGIKTGIWFDMLDMDMGKYARYGYIAPDHRIHKLTEEFLTTGWCHLWPDYAKI